MTSILASVVQTVDRLELAALDGARLTAADLDRIRDIRRDCSTCVGLLDRFDGRERE
ncbi:hypothetical protein [Bifidobacterium longum]|nr:hypothetical protein [Bifidobacterium longum]